MQPAFLKSSGNLNADRRYEYARQLEADGDLVSALDLLTQTHELAPAWPVINFKIGQLHRLLGHDTEAQIWLEHCLTLDPADHQGAVLELQLIGARDQADGMPAAFVAGLFDQYAKRFDTHLVGTLKYNVPFQISDLITRTALDFKPKRILDLGCGTGLSAAPFATQADYMEGVDLSQGMLDEAHKKSIYNKLVCSDILEYLKQPNLKCDLIIAADVFTYLGDLSDIFKTARSHLNDGGIISFSVQKLVGTENDFALGETHRYAHSATYLDRVIRDAGLTIAAQEEHTLRQDRGENVIGYIYLCTLNPLSPIHGEEG